MQLDIDNAHCDMVSMLEAIMSSYRIEIVRDNLCVVEGRGPDGWGYEIYKYDGGCCDQCAEDEGYLVDCSYGFESVAIAQEVADAKVDELYNDPT